MPVVENKTDTYSFELEDDFIYVQCNGKDVLEIFVEEWPMFRQAVTKFEKGDDYDI